MAERPLIAGAELDAAIAAPRRLRQNLSAAIPELSPLRLALLFILLFAAFCFLPRLREDDRLLRSCEGATAGLLLFLGILAWQVASSGRVLTYEIAARKVHYVQMLMHLSIYAYWGWYWRQVYHDAALIFVQVAFFYAFDCLVCWSRRDKWLLGFGAFPIVFSTNLFLRFHDQWFYLQFAMIAVGVLGKEFLKWRRDGAEKHIFNPSSLPLFLASVALLAAHATRMTWGIEIAHTFDLPPHIYLEIFLLGLVVQWLFHVTLVTLTSAAALFGLSLAFHHFTGTYLFADANIPVPVFLSLHLLITDPATSPRSCLGKIIFGTLYGAGVFVSYGALGAFGAPEFYDKLLCVPILNLMVRALDHAGDTAMAWVRRTSQRTPRFASLSALGFAPQRANFAFMGLWSLLFAGMSATNFYAVPFTPDWQDAHSVRADRLLLQIAPCIESGAFLRCFFRLTAAGYREISLTAPGVRFLDVQGRTHPASAVQFGDSTYPYRASAVLDPHHAVEGSIVFKAAGLGDLPAIEISLRDQDTGRDLNLQMHDVAIQTEAAANANSEVR